MVIVIGDDQCMFVMQQWLVLGDVIVEDEIEGYFEVYDLVDLGFQVVGYVEVVYWCGDYQQVVVEQFVDQLVVQCQVGLYCQ